METKRNILLGVFVLTGAALLIFALYSIGDKKNMFGKTIRISSEFYDANGLTPGNNVRYSGIDIGTVDEITIINDTTIKVVMLIEEKSKNYIRINAITSIGTDGLMGNKVINITPGSSPNPFIENDQVLFSLKTVDTEEMLRTLEVTNYNMLKISDNLRGISETINNSKGTLNTVLTDTVLSNDIVSTISGTRHMMEKLTQTSNDIEQLVHDIHAGNGTVGMMLKDTSLQQNISELISNLNEGSLHFKNVTKELDEILQEVSSGDGTLNRLLKDSLMSEKVNRAVNNIESASLKLDKDIAALENSFLLRRTFRKSNLNNDVK